MKFQEFGPIFEATPDNLAERVGFAFHSDLARGSRIHLFFHLLAPPQ